MNRNIIQEANPSEIRVDENYLYFPVTIDVENALSNNVRYLKLVVLPSEFNGVNNESESDTLNYNNFPFNLNRGIGIVGNDNNIDKDEIGSFSTPDFIKKVFSKNITTNLLQKDNPNTQDQDSLTIFPNQNSGESNEDFLISLRLSTINTNLSKNTNNDEYYKHYFILYVLDSLNNIVEYKIISAPEGKERIDQYTRLNIENFYRGEIDIIKEAFIDKVGGSIDIEFRNLNFNSSREILSGPYPIINYLNFLDFARHPISQSQNNGYIDFQITLRYFSNENDEVTFHSILSIPLIDASDITNQEIIGPAVEDLNSTFSRNLSEIVFLEETERSETQDVSDYFDNKFSITLFKDFLISDDDFKNIELTISYENFSYTKDIVVRKSNFMAYYNTVLLYYKEDIIRRTFLQKIQTSIVLNDLSENVLKLEIQKFDYKNYSLNVVKDNSVMKFLNPEGNSQFFNKLFLDDNLTETNSINTIRNSLTENGFYVNSVFKNNNTSTLYLEKSGSQESIIIKIDDIEVYSDAPIRIENEEDNSSNRNARINAINNTSLSLRDIAATRRNNIIDVQKDLNQNAFNIIVNNSNNNISLQFKINTPINREIIQNEFDIQVNSDSIEDQVYISRIENNTIVCINVFQTSPIRSFLGSINKHMSRLESLNDFKQISLQEEFNNFPASSSLEIEIKFFILNNGILNSIGQNITEDLKENICETLISLRPDQYHYIINKVENNWFNTSSQRISILNQFGSLLFNSNIVESTTIQSISEITSTQRTIFDFDFNSNRTRASNIRLRSPNKKIKKENTLSGFAESINNRPLSINNRSLIPIERSGTAVNPITSTGRVSTTSTGRASTSFTGRASTLSTGRTPITTIRNTPATSSTRKIKSSNSLNYITDFNFDNLNIDNIELNAFFNYKSLSFNVLKKRKNENFIYKINLNNNSAFSNTIKSNSFRSLDVYSCFVYSFYNHTSRISRREMTELNVNNQGILVDIEFIDIIRSYEFKIENQNLLIDKKFKKTLNFNERYYNKAKYIWAKNNNLILKSLYNRIVIEVVYSDGEKYFYAANLNVPLKNSSISNKGSNIDKSNLSIDINNNKLYNPNIILMFNK